MKIEDGKLYVVGDGRVLKATYNEFIKAFIMRDEYGDHICNVDENGDSGGFRPEIYNVVKEYKKMQIETEEMDNVKQVYLDQITGKTYYSLEELKASRNDYECKATLRTAISDGIPEYVDFDVEEFIYSLKCAKNKEQVLEYLKKEIL